MSNTMEKAAVNWYFNCQLTLIYENVKEGYFRCVQCTSWLFENSGSDSFDKNDMKEKVNDLVRIQEIMQKKIKSSIILRKNPDFYLST